MLFLVHLGLHFSNLLGMSKVSPAVAVQQPPFMTQAHSLDEELWHAASSTWLQVLRALASSHASLNTTNFSTEQCPAELRPTERHYTLVQCNIRSQIHLHHVHRGLIAPQNMYML